MPPKRRYLLTPTARRHLREAKAWSLSRWGEELTQEYFQALHEAAGNLAINYRKHTPRPELAGGTGLQIFPVKEHYIVYEPLGKNQIVIVAVVRQSRDLPAILSKGHHTIQRELAALRQHQERS